MLKASGPIRGRVELSGGRPKVGEVRHTLGTRRAPSVSGFILPSSSTQWPPEGPRRVSARKSRKEQEMAALVDRTALPTEHPPFRFSCVGRVI
jgi:hypothetical protein